MTIFDDISRFTWFYLLSCKSEWFTIFIPWFTPNLIRRSRLSGLTMEVSFSLPPCLISGFQGNYPLPSFSHTPQQNGVVERKHQHILRCSLMPLSYYGDFLLHILYTSLIGFHLKWLELYHPMISFIPRPQLWSSKEFWMSMLCHNHCYGE